MNLVYYLTLSSLYKMFISHDHSCKFNYWSPNGSPVNLKKFTLFVFLKSSVKDVSCCTLLIPQFSHSFYGDMNFMTFMNMGLYR